MLAPNPELKPIGPYIGQVVGYVNKTAARADLSWYLVHCVGKADKHVSDVLREATVEYYYPMIREFRPVPRKKLSQKQRDAGIEIKRPMLVPMLPRYRLLHIDPARRDLEYIFAMAGIGGLVCNGGNPVLVTTAFVHDVMRKEQDGALPGNSTARMIFMVGETVRVTDGPFTGFSGVVEEGLDIPLEELDPEMRIKVAIDIFSRATPVNLEVTQVAKL